MRFPLKFLVVSPTPTWPLDHGNRKRVYQICSELRDAGHEVHFVYYPAERDWAEGIPREALARMRQQWTEVHIVPPTRPLHALPKASHHSLDEWWDPALGDMLSWLFQVDRFDALIVNYVWLSKALEYAPRQTLRIIDTHDRVGGRKELLASQGLAPEFFYLREIDEIGGLNRADIVLAIKDQEAAVFAANCADHVEVVTLPYAEAGEEILMRARRDETVTFGLIGARNSLNRSSTEQLIAALRDHSDLEAADLQILIGGALGEDFQDLKHPKFVATGQVENIVTFYRECDVVVVPLASSTGQKVRVGEALALGMPLICHAHAFEGYSSAHPMHNLPTVEAVADAIIAVGTDPSLIVRLRAATAISRDAQRSNAAAGIARILERTAKRLAVTGFHVDDDLLESSGTPWLRLKLAIAASIRCGHAVIWLALKSRPSVLGASRLRQLSQQAALYAPPESEAHLASSRDDASTCETREALSFIDCLAQSGANVAWVSPATDTTGFSGKVILDDDLQLQNGAGDLHNRTGVLVGSRVGTEACGGQHTPFFLGRGNAPLWRTAKPGRTAWIVGAVAGPRLDAIVKSLLAWATAPIMVWTDGEELCGGPEGGVEVLNRQNLAAKMDRPDLAIVITPRSLEDALPVELLAQAGAACIVLDGVNADRYRRHAFEVADDRELMKLISLFAEARNTSTSIPKKGSLLVVEDFDLGGLLRSE